MRSGCHITAGIAYLDLKSENCLIDQQAEKGAPTCCGARLSVLHFAMQGLLEDDRLWYCKTDHQREVWSSQGSRSLIQCA